MVELPGLGQPDVAGHLADVVVVGQPVGALGDAVDVGQIARQARLAGLVGRLADDAELVGQDVIDDQGGGGGRAVGLGPLGRGLAQGGLVAPSPVGILEAAEINLGQRPALHGHGQAGIGGLGQGHHGQGGVEGVGPLRALGRQRRLRAVAPAAGLLLLPQQPGHVVGGDLPVVLAQAGHSQDAQAADVNQLGRLALDVSQQLQQALLLTALAGLEQGVGGQRFYGLGQFASRRVGQGALGVLLGVEKGRRLVQALPHGQVRQRRGGGGRGRRSGGRGRAGLAPRRQGKRDD
jgi:hypothetical protein